MNTGSRASRTLAPRSRAGDSNTTRRDRRSHWTGSRLPSSQSNWPQGRIQCRKILDQTATEGGVTSSIAQESGTITNIQVASTGVPANDGVFVTGDFTPATG